MNFIFCYPVPFIGQGYEKQNEPGTNDQSQNKLSKILLSVMYLTKFDNVI